MPQRPDTIRPWILADTSIWIEFLRTRQPVHAQLTERLQHRSILTTEVIFAELLQGARGRREREIIWQFFANLPQADPGGLLLQAGEYAGKHKLASQGVGLIDACLIVICHSKHARLWTLDKKLAKACPPPLLYSV